MAVHPYTVSRPDGSRWVGYEPVVHALAIAIVIASFFVPATAGAMPMFSRRFNMECSACHEPAVPRLNDLGYKFRRAGFRMPEQIGQEELSEFTLDHYFSGRVQAAYDVDFTVDGAGETDIENSFSDTEVALYPLTGAFLKYFASQTEIGLEPGEKPEIENAYIRAVWGNQDVWLEARVGVFHPIEGFGASDRSLGTTRPLFESESTGWSQETFVRVADLDRMGAEVGVQWKNTSLSVAVLNPLTIEAEDDEVGAEGTVGSPTNMKDLLITANQIFGSHSGIFAYWLRGSIRLPTEPESFAAGTSDETWLNDYHRLGLYGTLGTGRIQGLAGGMLGIDERRGARGQPSFRSTGAFVEGDLSLASWATAFVRADYFDSALSVGGNSTFAPTVGATLYWNWVFLVPELTHRHRFQSGGDLRETSYVLRAMAVY